MDWFLILEQTFNGLQFGIMLFLMAAGLTLVFGIMDFVNLAHGSLFMVGAYLATTFADWTGSFLLGVLFGIPATMLVGMLTEIVVLRTLYQRSHLDQVLATFGLILFYNELVRVLWGPVALFTDVPDFLSGTVEIVPGAPYPAFRLAIIGVGLLVALLLYLLVAKTRMGMLIRAGASNREMLSGLGVDVGRLQVEGLERQQAVEPEVGDLMDDSLAIAVLRGHHRLRRLFTDLLQDGVEALAEQAGDVAPVGVPGAALGHDPGQAGQDVLRRWRAGGTAHVIRCR